MRFILFLCLVLVTFSAQGNYPNRPITLVVPYPAGGGTDILARYISAKLSNKNKWNIVIENKSGASGIIGTDYVARSANDGYTLLVGHITPNAIDPGIFLTPNIQTNRNLDTVVLLATSPSVLIVRNNLPIDSVSDLNKYIENNNAIYATDGLGSLSHLQMIWFLKSKSATHVPYKGGLPALLSLFSDGTELLFSPAPVSIPYIQSGKVRAIAQTGNTRLSTLPNIPTMIESGLVGFNAPLWWGIFAPKNTDNKIITLWNNSVNEILREQDTVSWMKEQGYSVMILDTKQFNNFVETEKIKWNKIISQIK